ncbi:MAG: hypothetical protein G01um101416_1180 [Microgenomates group bacterium Gr01-1014_16]|nr:MAG: hypothetical protein G01um101416_1180 [Microgenomates group bacterium Gr01-1014_16]
MQTVSSTYAQRNFGEILDADEPVVIVRDSRREKILLDYDNYVQMMERERKARNDEFFSMLKKMHARNAHIPAKEVERDVEEALKYVRARRRGH